MPAEMRDEAMDICIIAVEKYQKEMEKCTQVGTTTDQWGLIVRLSHKSRIL